MTFEVGKLVTPVGSEPTEAHLNNNYSRGLLYQYGPFYHVGTRVSYPLHEKFTIGGMFVNGWNATGDNNSGKTFGVNLTWLPSPKFTFIQNFLCGPGADRQRRRHAHVFGHQPGVATSAVSRPGRTTSTPSTKWRASRSTGKGWRSTSKASSGRCLRSAPRFEWYNDPDGFVFGAGEQTIKEFTLTFELKHPRGLITRFEYRRDWSDVDYFTKDGDPTDNQNVFTVGFIVPFSSRAVVALAGCSLPLLGAGRRGRRRGSSCSSRFARVSRGTRRLDSPVRVFASKLLASAAWARRWSCHRSHFSVGRSGQPRRHQTTAAVYS